MKRTWSATQSPLAILVYMAMHLILVSGCDSAPESSESSQLASEDVSPQNVGLKTPEVAEPLPERVEPSLSDDQRPASLDAFAAEFKARFATDIYAPFVDLACWGEGDESAKRDYLKFVQKVYSPKDGHRATISDWSVEFSTVAAYESRHQHWYFPPDGRSNVRLVPPATHVMRATAHFGDFRFGTHFAVGTIDGRYYFCTIAP